MPTPRKGEKKADFIGRCMVHEETKDKYPDNSQRYAVCNGIYETWKKKQKGKK